MKGGDYMYSFQLFLEVLILFFMTVLTGCGATGGVLVVRLLLREWRKK